MSVQYDEEMEPIVISKPTLDIFIKSPNTANLIALYAFYYYTAKWQKTNQPKCTTEYAARGLKWTADKIRKTKKELISLGLISDIIGRSGTNGKNIAYYIKINFIWTKEAAIKATESSLRKSSILEMYHSRNPEGNTLSDSIYALSDSNNTLSDGSDSKKSDDQPKLKISNTSKSKKPTLPFIELFPIDWQRCRSFRESWDEWNTHRKQIKKPMTELAASKMIKKLVELGMEQSIHEIGRAIEHQWQGIYPEQTKLAHNKKGYNPNNFEAGASKPDRYAHLKPIEVCSDEN